MAQAPRFKIFDPTGEYVASCKHIEDAACLIGLYGDGAKIRDGSTSGPVVWSEGYEECSAADSYDTVALVVWQRIRERNQAAYARVHGAAQ